MHVQNNSVYNVYTMMLLKCIGRVVTLLIGKATCGLLYCGQLACRHIIILHFEMSLHYKVVRSLDQPARGQRI